MSFRAVTWALDDVRGFGATAKVALIALAEFANDEDKTWRSRSEIADRAECSLNTLDRHLKRLEDAGLITREALYQWCGSDQPQCAERGAHKHRVGTAYHLHLSVRTAAGVSTVTKMVTVDESLELEQNFHSHQNGDCEDSLIPQSANGTVHSHHLCRPFESVNPQLNPQPDQTLGQTTAGCPGLVGSGPVGIEDETGLGGAPAMPDPATAAADAPSPAPAPSRRVPVSDGEVGVAAAMVAKCLPPRWRPSERAGLVAVAEALRERLDAGWTQREIWTVMDRQDVPEQVKRLSSLCHYRLIQNVVPELAPGRAAQRPTPAAPPEIVEAAQSPAERAWDRIWASEWLKIGSQSPALGKVDQMHHTAAALMGRGLTHDRFIAAWEQARASMLGAPEDAVTDAATAILASDPGGVPALTSTGR